MNDAVWCPVDTARKDWLPDSVNSINRNGVEPRNIGSEIS